MTGMTTQQDNWTDYADEITEVSLAELKPSPFNARVIREDDRLRELADSIRQSGVQQPIIIREIGEEGEVLEFEIVAGHRRVRASQLAGRETIPAITRDLTDDEARELQITENLQREDLAAMDEAKAFSEAMTLNAGKMLSVQELAARLGKSPVYISRRLTLLDAIPDVQVALRAGQIEVGHALELARLSEAEQARLLEWLEVGSGVKLTCCDCGEDLDDGVWESREGDRYCRDCFAGELDDGQEPGAPTQWMGEQRPTSKSVVELRTYIARTTLRLLSEAPFDPLDATLSPEAGSCVACLKRTGASAMLFSDVSGDDVCTDPGCFREKVAALLAAKLEAARQAKKPLHQITQDYSKKGPQVHRNYDVTEVRPGAKRCGYLVEAIHVDGPRVGRVVEICDARECTVHHGGFSGSRSAATAATPAEKGKRKALLAKVKVEKEYRLQLFKELMARPLDPVPSDAMVRALVAFAIWRFDSTKTEVLASTLGWPKEFFSWQGKEKGLLARLMAYSQAELLRIALVGLEANELTVHEYDIERKNNSGKTPEIGLERVAKLIGVDAGKVRERFEPKEQPAKKAAVKPAKKAAVKPAKKAAAKKTAAKKGRAK